MRKKLGVCLLASALVISSLTGCANKSQKTEITQTTDNTENEKQEAESTEEEKDDNKAIPLKLANFEFTKDNFPRMDGSTSLVPLGKALVKTVLGESDAVADSMVGFNRTTRSYRNLMYGECDFILASLPDEDVFDEMKENNFECEMEEISTEALIFVVNADNPVDNLTTQQIIDIYTGKITNWSEVGGQDAPIEAFQRNKGSGSQALMEKLIMKDTPMMKVEAEYMPGDMGSLMAAVKSYNNSSNAIGYSVYYYANDMKMAEGLKIISIDGVEPKADTIRKKEYPHTNAYYCAISKAAAADSPERVLYDWIVSEDGQKLVAHEGYVSIVDTGIQEKDTPLVAARYTRMQEEFIPDLKADSSYGRIYPFVGGNIYDKDYGYHSGSKFGFVDENGRIIADPTYIYYGELTDYSVTDQEKFYPYWKFGRSTSVDATKINENIPTDENEVRADYVFGVATLDGNFVTECKYREVLASDAGIILREDYYGDKVEIIDFEGNTIFTEKDLPSEIKNIDRYFWSNDGDTFAVLTLDSKCYLVNLKGEIVAGPYGYIEPFEQGLSVVSTMDEDWSNKKHGIMDAKGNIVVPLEYDTLYVANEYYIGFEKNDVKGLMDLQGNVICENDSDSYYWFDNQGNYCCALLDESEHGTRDYYDASGQLAYSYEVNGEYQIGNSDIFEHDEKPGDKVLVNKLTGESTHLNGVDYVESVFRENESSTAGIASQIYERDNSLFYANGANKGYVFDDKLNIILEDNVCFHSIGYDVINGKRYYYMGWDCYVIYDENKNLIVTSKDRPVIMNDTFMITDDYSSKLVDANGKEIFCYPFTNTLED